MYIITIKVFSHILTQATSIWLLALLKNCPEREPIKSSLQQLQDMFMDFLSENSGMVFIVCIV